MQDLVADEDAEDGEEQQDDQAHKQHAPTGSKVILALSEEEKDKRLEYMRYKRSLVKVTHQGF